MSYLFLSCTEHCFIRPQLSLRLIKMSERNQSR
ncbi:redox-sensitive transcriptional activator SoxR, partial [Acinetobacter baumannii]